MCARHRAAEDPLHVVYLGNTFNVGGAEQLNLEIVRHLHGDEFTFTFLFLKREGALAGELRDRGVPIHAGFQRAALDLLGLPRLWRVAGDLRADLLFSEAGRNALLLSGPLARRLGARARISALHSTGRWGHRSAFRTLERPLLARMDGLVACAGTQRDYLVEQEGLPRRKLHVITNGVDHRRFAPREDGARTRREEGLAAEHKVVVIVASLTPEKGHEVFVGAAARVLADVPEARFLIIGDGPRRAAIERLTGELGVREEVRLLGVRRDLPRLLPACDLHVLSSHPFRETLPISTMEGMACGLPTVNTDVGSVRDLVIDGETGRIVPAGDVEALARAMTGLLRDDDRRRRMGRSARRRIEDSFTLERTIRGYADYFRRLAGPRAGSRAPGGGE
jgi:glycosyltransferase involved in cell wall biosynthesis